jgi:multiple sugar transport system permease protein
MKTTVHSPLDPTPRAKAFAGFVVIGYALISLIPLVWILMTSFRTPQDAIAYPPQVVTQPSLIGYVNLFTTRSRVSSQELAALPPPTTWYEDLVREQQMILAGPSRFSDRYLNSVLIGFGSTLLSVVLGTLAAYAFSRFRVPGKDDLLFFILSTRMMPPISRASWTRSRASTRRPRWSTATRASRPSSRWCCRRPPPASRPPRSSA